MFSDSEHVNKHKLVATPLETKPSSMEAPTISWLPKLYKSPNRYRFISSSRHCSTNILFSLIGVLMPYKFDYNFV